MVSNLLTNKLDTQLLAYIQSIPIAWQSDFYKQQVNRIVLKQREKEVWTQQDSIWLDFIASIDPGIGGEAVSSACAALKRECAAVASTSANRMKQDANILPNLSIEVFPNPTHEIINIKWKGPTEATFESVQLFDSMGKLMLVKALTGKDNSNLSVKNIESGLYKLIVTDSNNCIHQSTFVKQ